MPNPIAILSVASQLPLADDGSVPEWLMVMPAGTSSGVDGRGPYTLADPTRVAAQSMQAGRPLCFDYNHQTVFAAVNGSPSPAAGWIDKLEPRDGALWGHVDWTEGGRTAVASREYRFVSPAFRHDEKTGVVQSLASVGLVNLPNLRELPAIKSQLPFGDPMDKETLERLVATLGLPAGSTLDQVVAHCQDLTAKAKTPAITTGTPDPAAYVPMAAFAELQTAVASLTRTAAETSAIGMVDAATGEGKVTPAMKDWALSYASQTPDDFRKWAAAAPVIVAPGAILPGTPPADATRHAAREDDKAVLAVCSQFGITVDQYRNTLGQQPAQDRGVHA